MLSPHRHQQGRGDIAEPPKGNEEKSECKGSLRHRAFAHGLLRVPGHPPPRKGNGQKGRIRLHRPKRPHVAQHRGSTPRSLTLTADGLSICLSKEIAEIEPVGAIGIDRNLDNVTIADSDGSNLRHDLARATEVKARCRETKRHFKRNDARIRRHVYGKYGRIQRNRVALILHNVSASIVRRAKEKRFGIVMENIKGIRRLYRKGNGQGNEYRARLNSWSFYELQRQIEYKARWEGILVAYVAARGTSVNCSICGSRTYPNGQRTLHCSRCDISVDRDVKATRNVLAKGRRGVRFTPDGPPEVRKEAVKGNETTTPVLRADGGKVTRG